MLTFRYQAYRHSGAIVDGTIQAASLEQALEALWDRGLTPFEAHEDTTAKTSQLGFLVGNTPTRHEVAAFTREFATLVQADIPLDDALRIVIEQPLPTRMRRVLVRLLEGVLDGAPLSDMMSKFPAVFTADYVSLVRAGEASGGLGRGLVELSDLLDRRLELTGRVTSALIYPMILILVALASVSLVVGVLASSVAPMFAESGRPMPATVMMLVTLQQWWPLVLAAGAAVIGLALAIGAAASRSTSTRRTLSRLVLSAPVVGTLIREQNAARSMRTLGTLLRAGVPLISAFTASCTVIRNRHLAIGFETALEGLRDGQGLVQSLADRAGVPSAALRMIAVGEGTGRLDHMLLRAAIMLEQQSHRRIERLMTLLTPALTVGLALFVGALVLTIMNAILSINELAIQ